MTKKTKKSETSRHAVLITGAGSGIGLAFAEDCLKHPGTWGKLWGVYDAVIMVARDAEKLKKTSARLKDRFKGHGHPSILTLATDLSASQGTKTVFDFIKKNKLLLTGVVNNAGVGYMGEFSTMPIKKAQEIIDLNITSLTEISHAALSHFRERSLRPRRNPVIVNVASVVGLLPFPLSSIYAASKAYVIHFSEALKKECAEEIRLRGHGVEVYTLCPGSTRTAFFERAGKQVVPEKTSGIRGLLGGFMEADQVVRETREAIAKKKSPIIPGFSNRLVPVLRRILPFRLSVRIAHRFMKQRLD